MAAQTNTIEEKDSYIAELESEIFELKEKKSKLYLPCRQCKRNISFLQTEIVYYSTDASKHTCILVNLNIIL